MTQRKTPTAKQRVFAEHFADTLNATEAAAQTYDVKARSVAQSMGSENLAKPIVKRTIQQIMEERGISDVFITQILHRNIKQSDNIPASNAGIDIALKVKGQYAPLKTISATLNLDPSLINERMQDIMRQLKELNDMDTEGRDDTPAVPHEE